MSEQISFGNVRRVNAILDEAQQRGISRGGVVVQEDTTEVSFGTDKSMYQKNSPYLYDADMIELRFIVSQGKIKSTLITSPSNIKIYTASDVEWRNEEARAILQWQKDLMAGYVAVPEQSE